MTGSRKYNFKCQSFPNTIEQERRRRGWTVTKLAELSGVSRYSIAAYDRHGVPNALKASVYQIGTSRLPARPWKTLADERMRDKIQARMREVFQEEMSKNGGNEGKWNMEEVETEE